MARNGRNHRLILNLRPIYKKRGLTVRRLAESSGVSLGTLSDLLTGRTGMPSDDTLVRLCDALGVTPGELMEVLPQ